MKWFLYIAKAKDESLYTGISVDIEKRIKKHNGKLGAKALMGKLPVYLVYSEEYNTREEALKREAEIKSWKRRKKLNLISGL